MDQETEVTVMLLSCPGCEGPAFYVDTVLCDHCSFEAKTPEDWNRRAGQAHECRAGAGGVFEDGAMTTDPNAPDAALLPCPFCGETDAGIIRGDRGEPYVFCYCCEACGPLSKRDPVKLWNRRAGQAHERRADAGLLAALEAEVARLRSAIDWQAAAVRTLRANEETEINRLRKQQQQWHQAVASLDSEREANAMLTAEVERLQRILTALGAA